VVESTSQQAGLLALVEFDPGQGAAENVQRLHEALASIRTGAVAPAARDDSRGRFRRGDAVGFVAGEIVAWGDPGATLAATIETLSEGAEIVSAIAGKDAPIALGEIEGSAPGGVELELHEGGQPHYWWLLAAQ
jgi:dihydroxyacetone kinase-like predicted kinase